MTSTLVVSTLHAAELHREDDPAFGQLLDGLPDRGAQRLIVWMPADAAIAAAMGSPPELRVVGGS